MITYGEILEQSLLIFLHREHRKSKEERLTQANNALERAWNKL